MKIVLKPGDTLLVDTGSNLFKIACGENMNGKFQYIVDMSTGKTLFKEED